MNFVENEHTLNYLKKLPKSKRIDWYEKFPGVNPLAIDLLQRMLKFNPD